MLRIGIFASNLKGFDHVAPCASMDRKRRPRRAQRFLP